MAAYLVGTLLGRSFPGWRDLFVLALLFAMPVSLALYAGFRERSWRVLPLLTCLCLLAALRTSLRLDPVLGPEDLLHYVSRQPVRLECVLCRSPSVRGLSTRLSVEARYLYRRDGPVSVQGRADLFLADPAPDLVPGDILLVEARLRVPRSPANPGVFDAREWCYLRGVRVRGTIRDRAHLVRLGVARGYGFQRLVDSLRRRLEAFLDRVHDPEARALLGVWFLGSRSALPEQTQGWFRKAGLAHLLAISGLHVGLVGAFAYGLIKFLLKRSEWILLRFSVAKLAGLGCLPFLFAYVLIVGSPITAVRAAVMAALFVGSQLLDRPHASWNALALAALFIVVWDPSSLFSASFLLSFAAVAGLLVSLSAWRTPPGRRAHADGPWMERLGQRVKDAAWGLFIVSLGASAFTAPLSAYFFGQLSPLSVLVNLVAVPLVGWFVIPCGLAALALAVACTPAAGLLLEVTAAGAGLVAAIARSASRLPGASLGIGRPTILEIAMAYVFLFCIPGARRSKRRGWIALAAGAVTCLSVTASMVRARTDPCLSITFLSVGQGDGILVEFPGGKRMMVDGGPARPGFYDAGKRIVGPYLRYRRIGSIDFMMASHAQADHYGGLVSLVDAFRPARLWIPPKAGCEGRGYARLLDACRRLAIPVSVVCGGARPLLIHGVNLEVLSPSCPVSSQPETISACKRHMNDRSIVLRLTMGRVSVLLTGDIEAGTEQWLVRTAGVRLGSFLLKVPHHGSGTSSTKAFLEAVHAPIAVISTGYRNPFGFPAAEVLDRYHQAGTVVYRTDLDGAVRFKTDGRCVWVETFRRRRRAVAPPARPRRQTGSAHQISTAQEPQACREQQAVQACKDDEDPG